MKRPVSTMVDVVDLKSIGYGFESHTGYKYSDGSLIGKVLDCDSGEYGFESRPSHLRVINSTAECLAYTEKVIGSNPISPISGAWPSGKASDFESEKRRFDSFCPK